MRNALSIFIVILFWSNHSICQEKKDYFTITGRVIDMDTQDGLPFAMLRIQDLSIGTIANAEGGFEFHIPNRFSNDTIEVSMLGYYIYEVPIRDIANRENFVVLMQVRPRMLKEVVVKPINMTPREILAKALSNIQQNYPVEPFILHGFFRDSKKENGKFVSLLEAAIRLYDEEYYNAPKKLRRLLESVAIDEIRRSYNYTTRDEWRRRLGQENSLKELLGNNLLRYQYGVLDLEKNYNYEREDDVYHRDRLTYVISAPQFPVTEIYIDAESFAIVKFHFAHDLQEEEMLDDTLKRVVAHTSIDFEFVPFKGKQFLKYIRTETSYQDIDIRTQAVVNTADLYLEFLVNKVQLSNIRKFKRKKTMNKYKNLDSQVGKYNAKFWESYNVIKTTPYDEKLIEDLEKEISLKEQFNNQHRNNE